MTKSLYQKRDSNSSSCESGNDSSSDYDDDSEPDRVFFMKINSNEDLNGDEEYKVEGEVDLEAELISTLKEMNKVWKENMVLKEEAQGFEKIIVNLKK